MKEYSSAEISKVLLDNKLEFLHTIAETSMRWWTVAIVFSAAIIGYIWLNRSHVAGLVGLNWVCLVIAVLIASFPAYAVFIIWRASLLQREVTALLETLGYTTASMGEFETVKYAVSFGFVTFLCVLVLWIWIWVSL